MIVDATQICTFRTAGRLFGVPVLDIKEITTETTYTRIPHAPDVVLGYINIRGQIIMALDLKRLMGWTAQSSNASQCMVIFKPSVGSLFGLIVDDVREIVSLEPHQLEENKIVDLSASEYRSKLIQAIGKLENELLVLLNPRMLLPLIEELS